MEREPGHPPFTIRFDYGPDRKRCIGGALVINLRSDGGGSNACRYTGPQGSTDQAIDHFGNVGEYHRLRPASGPGRQAPGERASPDWARSGQSCDLPLVAQRRPAAPGPRAWPHPELAIGRTSGLQLDEA